MKEITWLIDDELIQGKRILDNMRGAIKSNKKRDTLEMLDQLDVLIFDTLMDLDSASRVTELSPVSLLELAKSETSDLQIYNDEGKPIGKAETPLFRFSQLNKIYHSKNSTRVA